MMATYNLLRELSRRGHGITVYSTRLEKGLGGTRESSRPLDGMHSQSFKSYWEGIFFSPSFARELATSDLSRFDVIDVVNGRNFPSTIGLLSALRVRNKLVFSANGSLMAYRHVPSMDVLKKISHRVQDPLLSKLLSQVSLAIAVSKAEVDHYLAFGVRPSRVQVAGNGIDLELFKPGESTFRQKLAIDDEFLVCYVGRLDPIKGLPVLLSAFGLLLRSHPSARLVIIGPDFGMKQSLIDQATRMNVRQFVHFQETAPPEVLVSAYRAADVVVIPSYFEIFGMAALEAMACGTPVIASNTGGLAEIVHDGVSGYLVPPGDSVAIASKLLMLAEDPDKKSFDEGTTGIARLFDIRTVCTRVEGMFKSLSSQAHFRL